MPPELLTLLKFGLLALLYVFVAHTVRSASADVYGTKRRKAPPAPRPAVAAPSDQARRSRKIPKEIVVHSPGAAPHVIALKGRGLLIGRGPGVDVHLEDVYASDEHAEILPDDGSWSVRDLGSTNGTYLNGAKVTRPTPLASGDQLRLGKTAVEVRR
ncbi:MAG: FHA domain-containing protein [Nitriliruptoraceae bacterium]|nr:FHA domain-containing protein [Nitriliruptoraceae bacterium]